MNRELALIVAVALILFTYVATDFTSDATQDDAIAELQVNYFWQEVEIELLWRDVVDWDSTRYDSLNQIIKDFKNCISEGIPKGEIPRFLKR